ncbi:hypothetical protein ABFV99_14130 [Cytobacillus horneckiae]|uniref:hypothetical protein n=1 Tax=Cytobacillus horneckiae TaxID=549687 RepID=UPI0034CD88E7
MAEHEKPVVNKITIEESAAAYDKAAKAHITKYGPVQANDLPTNIKTNVIDTKAVSNFLRANQGKIALGALGVGIAKSIVDRDDDDLLSSAGKGVKTAVVTTGLSYAAQHVLKTETLQDLVKGEVSDISKNVANKVDAERRTITKGGKIGTAFKIGLMAAGAATVMDVGQRAKERLEAEKIKQQQEKNLKKKQERQRNKNKEKSYGYIDDGEVLFDLFNARTGHYKMGNAKFN